MAALCFGRASLCMAVLDFYCGSEKKLCLCGTATMVVADMALNAILAGAKRAQQRTVHLGYHQPRSYCESVRLVPRGASPISSEGCISLLGQVPSEAGYDCIVAFHMRQASYPRHFIRRRMLLCEVIVRVPK